MKIRSKLLLGYLLVTSLVLAVLHVGERANLTADKAFEQASAHTLPVTKALQNLRAAGMRMVSSSSEVLFLESLADDRRASPRERDHARREIAKEARLVRDADREYDHALGRYKTLSLADGNFDALTLQEITRVGDTLQISARSLRTAAAQSGNVAELLELKEEFEASEMRFLRQIDAALAREELRINGIIETSTAELAETRWHYGALAIFLVASVVLVAFAATWSITRPLAGLIERVAHLETRKQIAKESPDTLVPRLVIENHSEVAELHVAFDAMEQRLEESRARLKDHQDDLANQVALRTRDRRDALKRAEALAGEARAASDAKAAFLANMSHEIRTPLNGVLGTAELLSHTELNTHQHELVHTITRSGDNLLRIINDILDFSKIDAGRLDLEYAPFSPGATLEEVARLLAPGALAKGVEFIAHLGPDAYRGMLGDSGRIRQIVMNLTSNAIKFTERGEVRLSARTASHSTGKRLIIEIADTSIGMDEEVTQPLFQSFSQADASTTRRFGGTGLGLVISRQLAELTHGTLAVRSVAGAGSVFTLELQLTPDAQFNEGDAQRLAAAEVLLYQSHPLARQESAALLRDLGMRVEAASGLQEAAEIAHRRTFAIVMAEDLDSEAGLRLSTLAMQAGAELVPVGSFHPSAEGKLSERIRFRISKPVLRSQLKTYFQQREQRQSEEGENARGVKPIAALPNTKDVTILVVEDNPVNRMVATQMLRRLGIRSQAVTNGTEAVAATATDEFALVLMDCQMPEMDGSEATRAIRAREASEGRQRLPIIALTANALKGDRERTLEAGMDDYLSKPVNLEALRATLSKWLVPAAKAGATAD